jgi:alanyl-tRNA synthetase
VLLRKIFNNTIQEIRTKYLQFFQKKGHAIIPSGSLVPEGDASTLFTSAGMQPMMPYLLGQKHPLGTRLVDSKNVSVVRVEEAGDPATLIFRNARQLVTWGLQRRVAQISFTF